MMPIIPTFNPKILDASIRDVASCLTDVEKADLLLHAVKKLCPEGCVSHSLSYHLLLRPSPVVLLVFTPHPCFALAPTMGPRMNRLHRMGVGAWEGVVVDEVDEPRLRAPPSPNVQSRWIVSGKGVAGQEGNP